MWLAVTPLCTPVVGRGSQNARVNASYVSEKERQCHDDMVWRLKVGQQWVWVYLLLEFQSEPDTWMAPRANIAEIDSINDILEANAMLEQTIERWFDEATMKGVNRGRQEGRQEGLTKAVALLIQMRFGAVPLWAQARLDDASEEQLIAWTGAILTIASLQDLFGSDGAVH